jgi:hypothetical protein
MTVDFGSRLPWFSPAGSAQARAYYDRTLNSLSPHVTTVWLADHLQVGDEPVFESWVHIAYLAGAYRRFRYGHLVNCQSFRDPAFASHRQAQLSTFAFSAIYFCD